MAVVLRETTSNVDMKHIGSERHCPLIPSTSLIDRDLFCNSHLRIIYMYPLFYYKTKVLTGSLGIGCR